MWGTAQTRRKCDYSKPQYGKAKCKDFKRKSKFPGVHTTGGKYGLANLAPKIDLRMESESVRNSGGKVRFLVSVLLGKNTGSQILHQKLTSVWRAKCKDFNESKKSNSFKGANIN